jgi:UDP-2-acetamido-2-deoxy-ribo-hexuluronate aminotransferase
MTSRTGAPATQGSVAQLSRPVPFFSQAVSFEEIWPAVAHHVNEVADRGKYSH